VSAVRLISSAAKAPEPKPFQRRVVLFVSTVFWWFYLIIFLPLYAAVPEYCVLVRDITVLLRLRQ
jgi:hypothetical protein